MDFRALGEALVAVAITPVISIGMAMLVVGAIIWLAAKVGRAEAEERPAKGGPPAMHEDGAPGILREPGAR